MTENPTLPSLCKRGTTISTSAKAVIEGELSNPTPKSPKGDFTQRRASAAVSLLGWLAGW